LEKTRAETAAIRITAAPTLKSGILRKDIRSPPSFILDVGDLSLVDEVVVVVVGPVMLFILAIGLQRIRVVEVHRDSVGERCLVIDLGSDENIVYPFHARDVLLDLAQHFPDIGGSRLGFEAQQDSPSDLAAPGGGRASSEPVKAESACRQEHRRNNDQPL